MAKYLRLLGRIVLRTVQAVAFYFLFVWLVITTFDDIRPEYLNSVYSTYLTGAGIGLGSAVLALGGVWAVTGIVDMLLTVVRRRRAGKAIIVALVAALALPGVASAQDMPLAEVMAIQLNVRAGPSAEADVLGQLARGGRLYLSGVSADGGWYFFRFWDADAWVAAPFVRIVEGEASTLPVVRLEPSAPIMPLALGPVVRVAATVLDPAIPRPGQPFRVALTLKNEGDTDAGVFSVASVLNSGFFAFATVQRLGAGASGTVTLAIPGEESTGHFDSTLIVDVERQLVMPEQDRIATLAYSIDQPYIAQSETRIEPFVNVDLHGGQADLAFNESQLVALGGAHVQLLADVAISDLHFDMLKDVSGDAIPSGALQPGAIIGLHTAEGRRGWLRIVERTGDALRLQYAVYAR